ncbi:hypothetical protein PY365_12980 [Roseiarcaceae bacterium H3SJ34-1]|uniref:hypothetical protein n=1 Tax=Terripilifer ovatus TaxID=3032367 RepID=UPI003AB95BF9|nr:hypothetical protein [Roseiarcaceae bacterium H3SJ34-1]
MRRFAKLMLAAGSLALLTATITTAEAQSRRYRGETRPTVVIKKRSFLDSGRVVPVGSLSGYVTIGTIYNKPPFYNSRSQYGTETLPRTFDIPGAGPLFNF